NPALHLSARLHLLQDGDGQRCVDVSADRADGFHHRSIAPLLRGRRAGVGGPGMLALRPMTPRVAPALAFIVFVGIVALFFIPILWMISTALKPLDRVFALPIEWVPVAPRWDNFAIAWNRFTFGRYFLNSLVVTISVTSIHVVLAAF